MTGTRADVVLRHIRDLAAAESADRQLLERFATAREEAAFEALVRRHGPLVLGVCRRVLHNAHDAEDAFQATFLALARQAASAGRRASLSTWLYRVAYCVALRTRKRSTARPRGPDPVPRRESADPLAEVTGREVLAVLDEELHQLPERLRGPLVLCYLQGKARDEAARELGWSLGTLKRRLEQGRGLLHARVTARGISLAALLAAGVGTAVVSPALAAATAGLAVRALRAMVGVGRKAVAVALLAACLVAAGAGLLGQRTPAAAPAAEEARAVPPAPAGRAEPPAAVPAEDRKEAVVTGRVVDADGKAVAGARIAAVVYLPRAVGAGEAQVAARAKTEDDGRYRLAVPVPAGEPYFLHLRAVAKGHGLGARIIADTGPHADVKIELVAERTAQARLVTIEGAAAAGVKVRVALPNYGALPDGEPWPGPLTTDERGRLTLRGLGLGTPVRLEIDDDRFVRQRFSLEVGAGKAGEATTFTLAPLRVIEGTIAADDAGKPVAGARVVVEAYANQGNTSDVVEGRADERGRYRVIPYDGNALAVRVFPPEGVPYLPRAEQLRWAGAAVKRALDVKLPRGVLVRGKVTDQASGKPVAGAVVVFRPRRRDNPHYREEVTGFGLYGDRVQLNEAKTGADGTFRLAALPGPGHLLVKGPTADYLHVETNYGQLDGGKAGGQRYYPDALVPLDHKPKAEPAPLAVALRRGVTVRGRVVGPDGKPVKDYALLCRSYIPWGISFLQNIVPQRDGTFDLPGCDPEKPTPVLVLDAAGRLGAVTDVSGKQAKDGPVTIRLAPCGSATVRLLDDRGKPWANQRLGLLFVHLFVVVTPGKVTGSGFGEELQADTLMMVNLDRKGHGDLRTDAEGRVTFPTLIPGATIALVTGGEAVKREFTVKAGEKRELSDVTMKRTEE